VNRVARTAIVLIAVQLVIRAMLAFRGYFYWDDLILTGRAGTQSRRTCSMTTTGTSCLRRSSSRAASPGWRR
jgi:hypothetical protein